MLVLIRMGTSMVSPYKSLLILWKHFLGYLVYEIFLWPKSWRGSLYIYLLSFPRFWTLSIERFWFLFWSILNGVALKTTNWGIFGFTICAWVERYFCKFKMGSRSWVTTHPWSRLGCSPVKFSTASAENVTTFLALKSWTAWRLNFCTVKRGFDANFIKKLQEELPPNWVNFGNNCSKNKKKVLITQQIQK